MNLYSINLPTDALLCSEINCSNKYIFNSWIYVTDITESCISAAESFIPCTCKIQNSGRIAGWSEHVQPLLDKSLFWRCLLGGSWVQSKSTGKATAPCHPLSPAHAVQLNSVILHINRQYCFACVVKFKKTGKTHFFNLAFSGWLLVFYFRNSSFTLFYVL